MKLHEIKIIGMDDYDGSKDDVVFNRANRAEAEAFETAEPLPGGSGLQWFKLTNGRYLHIYIVDPDIKPGIIEDDEFPTVGKLELEKSVDGLWTVASVAVLREYRGNRIGLALYGLALSTLGLTIASDKMQTEDGAKAWVNISKVPGVQIVAIIPKNAELIKEKYFTEVGLKAFKAFKDADQNKNLADFVKSIGGGSLSGQPKYWAIPVESGGSEMKSKYINVYGSYTPIMVARKS